MSIGQLAGYAHTCSGPVALPQSAVAADQLRGVKEWAKNCGRRHVALVWPRRPDIPRVSELTSSNRTNRRTALIGPAGHGPPEGSIGPSGSVRSLPGRE